MIIMVGSMAAGRHGTGTVAEHLHSIHRQQAERRSKLGMVWAFDASKPIPSDIAPLIRPHLLILLKWFYQLGTKNGGIFCPAS